MAAVRALAALCLLVIGCSSAGGGPGDASGTGGGGGAPAPLAGPCPDDLAIGHFALSLVPPQDGNDGYSQFGGRVRNAVDPTTTLVEQMRSGACRLLVWPDLRCDPPCHEAGTACVATNQCGQLPIGRSVGTVTVTGLTSSVSSEPLSSQAIYNASIADYPPALPGAAISLHATGGAYPPFTLAGEGIEPLVFPAPTATVRDNQPYTLTWTPARTGRSRILAELTIAHEGPIWNKIACDLPDTGAGEIPADIIHALFANGADGFPTLALTRRTVDATPFGAGCVDFAVSTWVQQPVPVEGIISCNCNVPDCQTTPDPLPCPVGHLCRRLGTPGGASCD
jgi:hypothetical protein